MEEKDKNKDYLLKKKKQFFHRRDVVEDQSIKSLPKTLIEAVKKVLKKKPEPKENIELNYPLKKQYKHTFVNTKPMIDDKA